MTGRMGLGVDGIASSRGVSRCSVIYRGQLSVDISSRSPQNGAVRCRGVPVGRRHSTLTVTSTHTAWKSIVSFPVYRVAQNKIRCGRTARG